MKNGKGLMSYEQLHELLQMTALQTSENAKQMTQFSKEFKADLVKSRKEHDREMKAIRVLHDREMKDLRGLLQKVIKHIAY